MKVILLRDVAKIGRRYQIIDVPDGFALNKLIPKGDAAIATPAALKRIENLRTKGESNRSELVGGLKEVAAALTFEPLIIRMQSNDKGHLFEAVHQEVIIEAAKARGLAIKKEHLLVSNHLKSTGRHEVTLKAGGESFAFPIEIIAK